MDETSSLAVALVVVRALHTGATLLLFGALVFVAFIDDAPRPAPVDADGRGWSGRRWLWLGWLLVALSGIAWLGAEAVEMSAGPWWEAVHPPTLAAVLGTTEFGHTWLVRGVLLVALGALGLRPLPGGRGRRRILAMGAGALLASLAWAGHANAQTGLDGVVHHVADAAHLLAAGAWVGGLPLFAARLRALAAAPSTASTVRCVRCYGDVAAVCVGVLVASGTVNAAYALGAPSLLVDSSYGRLLLAKLALFGVMLAIAAVNRWRLTPRLGWPDTTGAIAARRLHRFAWIELVIGAAVLVVASALATSAPPMSM